MSQNLKKKSQKKTTKPQTKQPKPEIKKQKQQNKLQKTKHLRFWKKLMKLQKRSKDAIETFRKYIQENQISKFEKMLNQGSKELIYAVLTSQDNFKNIALYELFRENISLQFLRIVNRWARQNKEYIKICVSAENPITRKIWGSYFYCLNKVIIEKFEIDKKMEKNYQQYLSVIGNQQGIYAQIAQTQMSLDFIFKISNNLRQNFNIAKEVYLSLFKNSQNGKNKLFFQELKAYAYIVQKKIIWNTKNYKLGLQSSLGQKISLLQLKELKFNFWHQLAIDGSDQFLSFIQEVKNTEQEDKNLREIYALLNDINIAGESPIDICLRKHNFANISKLLIAIQYIEFIRLTTNSLNKILQNRLLKKEQKQKLIQLTLSQKNQSKGYNKIIEQKTIKSFGQFKRKQIIFGGQTYSYQVCYDIQQILKQLSSHFDYPLLTYLKLYRDKSNLKIVQKLFLNTINKKDIKKQILLLLKSQKQQKYLSISRNSQAYKVLQFIVKYYEPLWKIFVCLPHSQIFTYLLAKIYVNCFQIKIIQGLNPVLASIRQNHFLRFYILNHTNLQKNQQNSEILNSIIDCKQSEKTYGQGRRLETQLLRSLKNLHGFKNSETYVCSALRDFLKIKNVQENKMEEQELDLSAYQIFSQNLIKNQRPIQKIYYRISKEKNYKYIFDQIKDFLSQNFSDEDIQQNSKLNYGHFSLSINQDSLVQKIQYILSIGMNPCFFSTNKQSLKYQIKDPLWNKLLNRMIKENSSFLTVLITEKDVKWSDYVNLFENCYKQSPRKFFDNLINQIQNKQRIVKRMNSRFEKSEKKLLNIDFLFELVKFFKTKQQDRQQESYYVKNHMTNFIKYNFQIYLTQISRLNSMIQILSSNSNNKEQIVKQMNAKQAQMITYTTKIIKMFVQQQELFKKQDFEDFLFYRMQQWKNKSYNVDELISFIPLKRIFDSNFQIRSKFILKKMESNQMIQQLTNFILESEYQYQLSIFCKQTIPKMKPQNIQQIFEKIIEKDKNNEQFFNQSCQLFFAKASKYVKNQKKKLFLKMIKQYRNKINDQNHLSEILISLSSNDYFTEQITKQIVKNYQSLKQVFYAEQQQKVRKKQKDKFYSELQNKNFDKYIEYLKDLWQFCPDIENHLNRVLKDLIHSNCWQRVMKILEIKQLQRMTMPVVLDLIQSIWNRERHLKDQKFKRIVDQMFNIYEKQKMPWSQQLFVKFIFIDMQKAFKVLKPTSITSQTFYKCYAANKKSAQLFVKAQCELDWIQITQGLQYEFFHKKNDYYFQVSKQKKLITFYSYPKQKLSLTQMTEQLPQKAFKDIFDSQQKLIESILVSKSVKSLKNFQKYYPNIRQSIRSKLLRSNRQKGNCINLSSINQELLKQLIKTKILFSQVEQDLWSILLRIICTANFQLLNLFKQISNAKIDKSILKKIANKYRLFWDYLLDISSDRFIIDFIQKYNLLQQFLSEERSRILLQNICFRRRSQLLVFLIKYFQKKKNIKVCFKQETSENCRITQAGQFYMPVEVAKASNFYQCYYLIKASNNQCSKFKISGRCLSLVQNQLWHYIPQFKRRVQLANKMKNTLKQENSLQIALQCIYSQFFELERQYQRNKNSLQNFIGFVATGQMNFNRFKGFQICCLMIAKREQLKIPDKQLFKKYPSQMNIIDQFRANCSFEKISIQINQILEQIQIFKPEIFIYSIDFFMKNYPFVQTVKQQKKNDEDDDDEYEYSGNQNYQSKFDKTVFIKGVAVNLLKLQKNYPEELQKILALRYNSINQETQKDFQLLLLVLFDLNLNYRNQDACLVVKFVKKYLKKTLGVEQLLFQLSLKKMGKNRRLNFDSMAWLNFISQLVGIIQLFQQIQATKITKYNLKKDSLLILVDRYYSVFEEKTKDYLNENSNISFQGLKEYLCRLCVYQMQKRQNIPSLLLQTSILININFILSQLKTILKKIYRLQNSEIIQWYTFSFGSKGKGKIQINQQGKLLIQFGQKTREFSQNKLFLIELQFQQLLGQIQRQLLLKKLSSDSQISFLNTFFKEQQRALFINYECQARVQSFSKVTNIQIIKNILQQETQSSDIFKLPIIDVQTKLKNHQFQKIYDFREAQGPLYLGSQVNSNKILDYLAFYKYISPANDSKIYLEYTNNQVNQKQANKKILSHLKKYMDYIAKLSTKSSEDSVEFERTILCYQKQESSGLNFNVNWSRFAQFNIAQVYGLIQRYSLNMMRIMDEKVNLEISFLDLVKYYQKYLDNNGHLNCITSLKQFLFSNQMISFLEFILASVSDSISNIVNLIKGVLIKFPSDINPTIISKEGRNQVSSKVLADKSEKQIKTPIMITSFLKVTDLKFQFFNGMLEISIVLQMSRIQNSNKKSQTIQMIQSQKQKFIRFFNPYELNKSIFTDAKTMTDYFLTIKQLDSDCIQISDQLTKKMETQTKLQIDYLNLHAYIENMRKKASLQQLQFYFERLKNYLHSSILKNVQEYIGSKSSSIYQKINLFNKCQAINRNRPLQQIQSAKQIVFSRQNQNPFNGLKKHKNFLTKIKHSKSIKNNFLIQINKGYYSAMVLPGMKFLVGYKQFGKQPQIITIRSQQNLLDINPFQLEYLMLISKTIPSRYQINYKCITSIYVIDSSNSIYEFNENLQRYFLSLPQQHKDRNINFFMPLLPKKIIFYFYAQNSQIKQDSSQSKYFGIKLSQQDKFKCQFLTKKTVSTINQVRQNLSLIGSVQSIQKKIKNFFSKEFIITLQAQQKQNKVGTQQKLFKFLEYFSSQIDKYFMKIQANTQKSEALIYKTYIANQQNIFSDPIVNLKKETIVKYWNKIKIIITQGQSGVQFKDSQLKILISVSKNPKHNGVQFSQQLDTIFTQIVNKQKLSLPPEVKISTQFNKENIVQTIKMIDIMNILPWQIQCIKQGQKLLKTIFNVSNFSFKIEVNRKHSQIRYDKGIIINFSIEQSKLELFSSQDILRAYMKSTKNYDYWIQDRWTYMNPVKRKLIVIYLYSNKEIQTQKNQRNQLIIYYQNQKAQWIKQALNAEKQQKNQSIYSLNQNPKPKTQYFVFDENMSSLCSNYFVQVDEEKAIQDQKNQFSKGIQKYLYLQKSQILSFEKLSVQSYSLKQQTYIKWLGTQLKFNIQQKQAKIQQKFCLEVKLLSKNAFCYKFNSSILQNIQVKIQKKQGFVNLFKQQKTLFNLNIVSDNIVHPLKTKFLEIYVVLQQKKIPIEAEKNKLNNSQFSQQNKKSVLQQLSNTTVQKDNPYNTVYFVNESQKKYLTKAGEQRIQYVQLRDYYGFPISYTPNGKNKIQVYFVHVCGAQVIRADIVQIDGKTGFKWKPFKKGHYDMYINSIKININYEIGIYADTFSHKNTQYYLPSIKSVNYFEQIDIIYQLRDQYNNIFNLLQEEILNQNVLISVKCEKLKEFFKQNTEKTDKYGRKKIKMSFDNDSLYDNFDLKNQTKQTQYVQILWTLGDVQTKVNSFTVSIQGLSLTQRKILLKKDIALIDPVSRDIKISKKNLLEQLYILADPISKKQLKTSQEQQQGQQQQGQQQQGQQPVQQAENQQQGNNQINQVQSQLKCAFSVQFIDDMQNDNGIAQQYFYHLIGEQMTRQSYSFFKNVYQTNKEYFFSPQLFSQKKAYQYMNLWGKMIANSMINGYSIGIKFSLLFAKLLFDQQVSPSQIAVFLPNISIDKCKQMIQGFKLGFNSVCDIEILKKKIYPSQFWSITSYNKQLSSQEVLKQVCFRDQNDKKYSLWFIDFIRQSSRQVLQGFLNFISECSCQDSDQIGKITISFQKESNDLNKTPIAHAGSNELLVPKYKSFEIMKKVLNLTFLNR